MFWSSLSPVCSRGLISIPGQLKRLWWQHITKIQLRRFASLRCPWRALNPGLISRGICTPLTTLTFTGVVDFRHVHLCIDKMYSICTALMQSIVVDLVFVCVLQQLSSFLHFKVSKSWRLDLCDSSPRIWKKKMFKHFFFCPFLRLETLIVFFSLHQ